MLTTLADGAEIGPGVTGNAVPGERRMADVHLQPRCSDVTGIARCAGRNVVRRLGAACEPGTVAVCARRGRLCVVERANRLPLGRRLEVAAFAQITGRQSRVVLA